MNINNFEFRTMEKWYFKKNIEKVICGVQYGDNRSTPSGWGAIF